MLSYKNVKPTIGLAMHFADKGLSVCPKPNTVLSECVRYTNVTNANFVFPESSDTDSLEFAAVMLENVSTGNEKTPSEHDAYMDQVSESIAKAVLGHVSFARNVVKPVVMEVGEKIQASINRASSVPKLQDKVQIVELDIPSLLSEPEFVNELELYKHKPVVEPTVVAAHGKKTKEEILSFLTTGSQDVDEKIIEWYSNVDEKWVCEVWCKYFVKDSSNVILNLSLFKKLDMGILLYLLASKFMADASQAQPGINLQAYKQAMSEIKDHGGRLIVSSLSLISSFDKTRRVVVEVSNILGYCHVYGPNYQTWLKEGGCPEAILGLIVSNGTAFFHNTLLQDKKKLCDAWSSYVSFSDTDTALKKFDEFKSNVILAVRESYAHPSDLEKNAWLDNPNFETTAAKLLQEEIDALRSSDMLCPYDVALRVVCRSRFYYTSAEKILSGIQAVIQENENLDPREAATISVMTYVAEYIADQMVLTA